MTDPGHEIRKTKVNGWYCCILFYFGLITVLWAAGLAWLGYIVIPILVRFYGNIYYFIGSIILIYIFYLIIIRFYG